MVSASELPVDTLDEGTTAISMAQTIFGSGVTIVSASYSGDTASAGIYSNGNSVAPGATPSDTGVILSTGSAEDFTNSSGEANQSTATSTNTSGANNLSDFNTVAGASTFDSAFLDADFIPTGDVMAMQFVFSSEEYTEFQNSVYQDFVSVWINGNPVDLAVGNADIDPGNVNSGTSENLFVDNSNDDFNTEMDGLTITLSLTIPVTSGAVNSIRIGIADVGDQNYDSNLLIAANSLQTDLVAVEDSTTLDPNGSTTIDVLDNDVNSSSGLLLITHLNGEPVVPGQTVTLNTGQTVTLNFNATLTITGDGDVEDFNFTYAINNGFENDTGIVNVSSIPCFVAGTQIATAQGNVAVETLQPDDLVWTKDDGLQPLRWIGQRTLRADGAFAPIYLKANTFGQHDGLLVSPEHRILIRDSLAELLFGEEEVLIAAKHLVNGKTVTRRAGGLVTYVHMMFDSHQVVFSEGLETESYLPGPQTQNIFAQDTLDEICAIFPEIDPSTGHGYSRAARRTLKEYEAGLWLKERVAA
ncbi:MAG: Hint domain-containing protein [Paracoccaceae bacterium]